MSDLCSGPLLVMVLHTAPECGAQLLVHALQGIATYTAWHMQIAGVVKLLANKGKRREAIATATGCRISVPSMEDWDGENDVVIAFEGGNIDTAQQLIAQALKA